jgi:O-antigen/teichoic acid export membrane protein
VDAVLWGGAGAFLRIVIQVGSQIALARILGPEQYGLFAIGVIVVSLAVFFSDSGLAYGLIQKPEVSDEDIRFVFTWQIILGCAVSLLVVTLGGTIAGFFNEPRAERIIQALAVVCFLNALGAIALNLLKRELDFKRLHLVQAGSYFCGFVLVGIPLAMSGAQAWALVVAFVVQSLLAACLMYRVTRHPVGFLPWQPSAGYLIRYGVRVLATNLINWVMSNADRVLVGRLYSSAAVGVYATSYNVVSAPAVALIGVLQSALFSVFARAQDRPEALGAAMLTVVGAAALFVMPVFIGLGAVADTFVLAVYGEQWINAAEVLRPLAWSMPLYLMLGMVTPLLWTSGRTAAEFLVQLPIAALWVLACVLAARYSFVAVAWIVLILFFVRFTLIFGFASRALRLGAAAVGRALMGGVLVAGVVAVTIVASDHALRSQTSSPQVWLAADMAAGAIAMAAGLYMVRSLLVPGLRGLINELAPRLPGPVGLMLVSVLGRGASR